MQRKPGYKYFIQSINSMFNDLSFNGVFLSPSNKTLSKHMPKIMPTGKQFARPLKDNYNNKYLFDLLLKYFDYDSWK